MTESIFAGSGSVRMDRLAIAVGAVAILALFAIGQWRGDGLTEGEDTAATASETSGAGAGAPLRRVSAVGNLAPEPPGVPGEVRRSHASLSYEARFNSPPDNEMEILERAARQVREAEAAARASGPPAAAPPGQLLAAEGVAVDPETDPALRPDGS
jgi:hypothetical protein